MNIVFFGSPATAIIPLKTLKDAGHRITLVVTQPDRPSGRGKRLTLSPVKKFALNNNIPVFQPNRIRKDPLAIEKLQAAAPDLNIVVAYGQFLPDSIIYFPRYHSLNIHYSLLPKYRGASPVQWAILNGEKSTGVTIFELNAKMDEGLIFAQKESDILPGETAAELENRLTEIGTELLLDTIKKIDSISPQKQDHSLATYAPLIKKEDGRIDWKWNAEKIENQIRAFTPWPSSFCYYDNKRIKIINGQMISSSGHKNKPGEILIIKNQGINICCGNGSLFCIELLQPENKKPMSAYAFSLGARIKEGTIFS
jgi:methionyl-tRNA formyltransferase